MPRIRFRDQIDGGALFNTIVSLNAVTSLIKNTDKSFSPRLINWIEPYIIQGSLSNTEGAGLRYTLFYTEVNHNLKVGDRVFIINGNYDSDLLIKEDKYKKGRDGYKVLFVDRCQIVLDIEYTGVMPYESQSIDEFINLYYIRNEFDFKHANRSITTKNDYFDYKYNPYNNNIIYADVDYQPFGGWGENGGLTGSPGFYVKNGTSSWINITNDFINGSFSVSLTPGSTASRVKVHNSSFTFSIGPGFAEFEENSIYKFDMAEEPDGKPGTYSTWLTDVRYEIPIITKTNFRGGNFKGTWNTGLFGRSDKKINWEGDTSTFNTGTILNTIWQKGKINALYTLRDSYITEFDKYGLPGQKSTGPNNNGKSYNFIIESDILSAEIKNGTVINCIIGQTPTYSVIENFLTSATQSSTSVTRATFDNCTFNGGVVRNADIKKARASNTIFDNVKVVNSSFKNSVFKLSNYISDSIIKILDYDELSYWDVTQISGATHKIYKFYISKKDWENLRLRDRFYFKDLGFNDPTLNQILNLFDNRFRFSTWTDYSDEFNESDIIPESPTYSFYKRGIEVASFLSTPADNKWTFNTTATGSSSFYTSVIGTSSKAGYSVDIVISKYDKNSLPVNNLNFNRDTNWASTASLILPQTLGNFVDVSKGYIIDSDFESGLFINSNWNAGNHINYNNDVNITENSTIGNIYNLDIITSSSTLIATTTYNLNYKEAGENCLSPGNVVYLNSIDYNTKGQIYGFTVSFPGNNYILSGTFSALTTGYGNGYGAVFDITSSYDGFTPGGGILTANITQPGFNYQVGDIITLQNTVNPNDPLLNDAFIQITAVTGSITTLPDTYLITQNFGNVLYLKEIVPTGTSSILSSLLSNGVFHTPDAQNRYGYIYKTKLESSKIKSGLFKRAYFKNCLIQNNDFDTKDKDLLNISKAKSLLIYESLFKNNKNVLSKALYMNSFFVSGSDRWNNGIIFNSIWNGGDFLDGVFRQGRWVNGVFRKGIFYDSKTFNKTSSINNLYYDSENIRSYFKDGYTSDTVYNNRFSWQNGTFSSGEIYKSDWENGYIKYSKFWDSNFYNGKIENSLIGDRSIVYDKTHILGGSISYATVESANLFADDYSFYGLSGSQIDWYNGIFQDGVFGCEFLGTSVPKYRATWHDGVFNGGEFRTNANWKTGIFNGGRFITGYGWTYSPTYDNLSINQLEYGWETGTFNGGEFGTAEYATNSVWYTGQFNGGKFIGRLWNNGIFTFGQFEGGATYSSVGGASNSNASDFTDSFSQSFYGIWRNGLVSIVKSKFIFNEKLSTDIESTKNYIPKKPMSYIKNALWLSGTFSHQRATMQNVVWLDGAFERGYFENSSFNPFVKRPSETFKRFNTNDLECYWENGELKNSDFNYSVWEQGKFVSGTGYGLIFKNGVVEYMNAFNIFWENGLWRNGNWYGSSFEYNGIITDDFTEAILNRGLSWSNTTTCHFWNIFEDLSDSAPLIIEATSSVVQGIGNIPGGPLDPLEDLVGG
jgi:hypothetical protein